MGLRPAIIGFCASTTILLLAGCGGSGSSLSVTAFQREYDATQLISRNAPKLRTVAVEGVGLAQGGHSVSAVSGEALAQLAQAHRDHLHAELLLNNFDGRINDFSEPLAHGLLGDPANIRAVSAQIVRAVRTEGWDGVCVDLESLNPRDSAGLLALLETLRRGLPAGRTLSATVMNETSTGAYAGDGYDLSAISRTVDRVVLMGYDQHGPWERTPGPIGSLDWQKAGLHALLQSVPAGKVDLGVAGYGYAWGTRGVKELSDAQARGMVSSQRGRAQYESKIGEWTAKLRDGYTLWWSDGRSYEQRAALARQEGVHGLALWVLGLSDPLPPA
jgi:spore germination protein YaaH